VNGFSVDFCHTRASFVLVVVVALFIFMVPVFINFFESFQTFVTDLRFRLDKR